MTDTRPTLRFVRVHLGKSRMDVVVDDPVTKAPRLVKYRWKTKVQTNVPPADWHSTVLGEVMYQRSEELRRERGLLVPGR